MLIYLTYVCKSSLSHFVCLIIPQSHRWNRPQTDKNFQIQGEIGLQSVLIRFCRIGVGLCSRRQIFRGEIFQTYLKYLYPTNCRLSVAYMSVWCRFCRGAFDDVSVINRPPVVDGQSVLDRLCIGHISADLTPIPGRFKTESNPTWHRIAWSRPIIPESKPTSGRHIRTQTECKPIPVCVAIPI